MIQKLENLLRSTEADCAGIYSGFTGVATAQKAEIELRERVATKHYDDYLDAISKSHSISVMDHEVDRFLANMPRDALILDVGG